MANINNILDGSHQEAQRKQERREGRLWALLAIMVTVYGINLGFF